MRISNSFSVNEILENKCGVLIQLCQNESPLIAVQTKSNIVICLCKVLYNSY